MSTTGRGREDDEDGAPAAPPIPSFASLRAPRRTHAALDVLLGAPTERVAADEVRPVAEIRPVRVEPVRDERVRPTAAPAAGPRPAEWPDLLWFGVRVASAALRLPGVLMCEPARRLRRLLGE